MLKKATGSIASRLMRWPRKDARGLGIDIGQFNTQIVWARRFSEREIQIAAATIPTFPPTIPAKAYSAGEASLVHGDAPLPSAVESERRIPDSDPPQAASSPLNQWSKLQIKRLMLEVDRLIGGASRFRGSPVNVVLSMSACDYRTLYIPKDARISMTTIQQTIAQATGDGRSRCVAILPAGEKRSGDKQEGDKQSRIRCLSIPEDISWSVARELDEIGLTPRRIDGLPWCLANALELCKRSADPRQIAIAIDWSFGNPTLVSVKDGAIDYIRCLSTGGIRELVSQAMAVHQLTVPEAVRWMDHSMAASGTSLARAETVETRDWIVECCTKLGHEVNTALDFIRWRNPGREIDAIWLMGGGARVPGLEALLASRVSAQVKSWELQTEQFTLTADYAMAASLAWLGAHHA